MNFSAAELFLIVTFYLLLLFGVAYATERGLIAKRLVQHPLTHTLSLGIYASVWTFYGAFSMFNQSGLLFLSSYLGATTAFLLAPVLLIPIFNITNRYKLSSLADLFAFRFRSGVVGTLTTIGLLVATLPLLSIQIKAVTDSLHLLNSDFSAPQVAAAYCSLIAMFAILFGARHPSMRARNRGLIMAMATSSFLKLLALLLIAGYVFFEISGGVAGVSASLTQHPERLEHLYHSDDSESWRTLLLAFFTATLVMPHMFHLLFTENHSAESLRKASWGMPLYLFLLAICVPIISWAAQTYIPDQTSAFVLLRMSQTLNSEWMLITTFLGGIAAASGVIIVASISLASMLQNHLILPFSRHPDNMRFYTWLIWLRRMLISLVILCSYLFYLSFGADQQLQLLGLSAFIAFLQFLPGLLATLFWPGANRTGFIAGLSIGMLSWLLTTFYPTLRQYGALADYISITDLDWQSSAILSLLLNITFFIAVSRLTPTAADERRAGEACLINTMDSPPDLHRPEFGMQDIIHLLTPRIGEAAARRELRHAMQRLGQDTGKPATPLELLRLRSTLEQNLSALIGPVEAATLLEPLAKQPEDRAFQPRDLNLLETHLETYQARLSGLAAELDELRRHHKTTLEKLPLGALTVTPSALILFWNQEMVRLTGLSGDEVMNQPVDQLPTPWDSLITQFLQQEDNHLAEKSINLAQRQMWLTLHKSRLADKPDASIVILIEDQTEHRLLTDKLTHSERLASIGRFAAGVAHEIGNPVTGIACLAQNLSLETDQPEVLDTGDQIIEQTKRISRIVQSLVRFSHTGQTISDIKPEPFSLNACIEEAIHLVSLDTHARGQDFIQMTASPLTAYGDPQLILQVLVNLLNNASDASPPQGKIWIRAEAYGSGIKLSITDEGTGIDSSIKDKLFEPFFTTKEPGKGTGLGLPLVYNILTEHCGNIEIISPANNKQKKGTQVIITLPGSIPDAGES